LAAADNVSLEPASKTSDSNQAFSLHALSGDYRRIVVKPQDLTWKLLEYSNPDEPLALSELEKLSGDKEPAALQGVFFFFFLGFYLDKVCQGWLCVA